MQFLNALSAWQWAVAAAIPLGVIALYFLKLRRQPVQVPSTYLWQKSVEDIHVNSLFQRLRRNLLLFLQLLVLSLALLALLRPAWIAGQTGGQRHVIVIDNSASMSATDVEPSRLEWAKQQARTEVVDKMTSDDEAMLIVFNDSVESVLPYTSNRQLVRQRIDAIEPTKRTTNLREALEVAAGLANPQKFREGVEEIGAPKLHLFSDGGFPDVKDFALSALEPHFYAVGQSDNNVGIIGMMVRRNEEHPDKLQVFARLRNFSTKPISGRTELYLDNELRDVKDVELKPAEGETTGEQAVVFDLGNLDEGVFELHLVANDSLAIDNRARCVVGEVRRGKVLIVSSGNKWLDLALNTEAARQVADIDRLTPEEMETDEYKSKAASGQYDLIIYDGSTPPLMPASNTLFLGSIPNTSDLGEVRTLENPIIAEVNDAHPLFRFVGMENVAILQSKLPELPSGTEVLVESGDGPLAFILTREGFWDCVIGFPLERDGEEGRELNTNWVREPSFPLFVFNALRVLGNVQDSISEEVILPGQPVAFRSETLAREISVRTPAGEKTVKRTPQGSFVFNATDDPGVYEYGVAGETERRFAVNLFDARESNILPRPNLEIGHSQVTATKEVNKARREIWRWLVLAALGVLLVEWYIYNRRVYI